MNEHVFLDEGPVFTAKYSKIIIKRLVMQKGLLIHYFKLDVIQKFFWSNLLKPSTFYKTAHFLISNILKLTLDLKC